VVRKHYESNRKAKQEKNYKFDEKVYI
jgi:hypothetical protein